MSVSKYLPSGMYGFLRDEEGREAFFHLGSFVPCEGEQEPVPPIPGELVLVEVDFETESSQGGKAARASRVVRQNFPQLKTGIVDKFDQKSGYGFVSCEGKHFFLHRSEIHAGKIPLVGDQVQFYVGEREGKTRACHAVVLRKPVVEE